MQEEIGGYVVHPAAQVFPLLDDEDLALLLNDIKANGQREPIILIRTDDGNQILDGRNRMRVLVKLGIKPEFDWFDDSIDGDSPIKFVISKNLARRHLNESQRAMVGARLKPLFEVETKQRRDAQLRQNQAQAEQEAERAAAAAAEAAAKPGEPESGEAAPTNETSTVPADRPKRSDELRESRDQVAQVVNVGSRTVSRAETALKNGVPELIDLVERGRIRVDLAAPLSKRPAEEQRAVIATIKRELEKSPRRNPKDIVRRHDKAIVVSRIRSEPMPLPEGPFRVIQADPAWKYEKRSEDGTQRGQTPYPGMTVAEICALGDQIQGVAYFDCVLWLWITNSHLLDGVHVEVLKAWDFRPKALLTWRKPKMGTGDWLRGKTEHCIMAVRGRPTIDLSNQTTDFCVEDDNGWYFEAPVGEHSEKPTEFYEFIERLCPGSKLEMFSRKGRDGWQAWGAEVGKLDESA